MSLEDLEKELYGQKISKESPKKEVENKNNYKDAVVENPWATSYLKEEQKSGNQIGKINKFDKYGKFLIVFLVVVLIGFMGLVGFYLYQYFTTKDVNIEAVVQKEVLVGVPFQASYTYENLSKKVLMSPEISFELPEEALYLNDVSKRVVVEKLDRIEPGEIVKKEFNVIIIGKSLSTYKFNSVLSYSYEASALTSRFDKSKSFEILARDSVIGIDVATPGKVLNGEDFEVHISCQNMSLEKIEGARIQVSLPDNFKVKNSDPTLDDQNGFLINSLDPNERKDFVISGAMSAKAYTYFSIGAKAQVAVGSQFYDVNEKNSSISLSPSSLGLAINSSKEGKVVFPGEEVKYTLNFVNNSDINLSDVVLEAKIVGQMFDIKTVMTDGYFNDKDNTITWTASNLGMLKELKAKESGSVSFGVMLKSSYEGDRISDKNFVIKVDGTIISPTVPYGVVADKTIGIYSIENKIGGNLFFDQTMNFDELSGDIKNNGSLPPRVNQEIQYTIHWQVGAMASDYKDIKISSFLGPGVKWTGKIKSNISNVPIYNERTQEVVWEIPSVLSGRGLSDSPIEAIFQVSFVPSINLVGKSFEVISKTDMSAIDSFTSELKTISVDSFDSKDLSDSNLMDGYYIVTN